MPGDYRSHGSSSVGLQQQNSDGWTAVVRSQDWRLVGALPEVWEGTKLSEDTTLLVLVMCYLAIKCLYFNVNVYLFF